MIPVFVKLFFCFFLYTLNIDDKTSYYVKIWHFFISKLHISSMRHEQVCFSD